MLEPNAAHDQRDQSTNYIYNCKIITICVHVIIFGKISWVNKNKSQFVCNQQITQWHNHNNFKRTEEKGTLITAQNRKWQPLSIWQVYSVLIGSPDDMYP